MSESRRPSAFRWIVLTAFMLVTLVTQVQWLSHAPVARAAAVFYEGQFNPDSLINIDFLALSYMLMYLVMSVPASYVIDTWGIRIGIGIGTVIVGAASLLKGIFAADLQAVLFCQLALAVAQPFILNAVTALSARWFPLNERGLAAGLSALAQYLGIIAAMLVIPVMVVSSPDMPGYGSGLDVMLRTLGIISFAVCVPALLLIRERPPAADQAASRSDGSEQVTDGGVPATGRVRFSDGMRHILRQPSMLITIGLFFIGLGIFNAVSSMVDSIASFLGVRDSDGLIGGIMLIGGVAGALILPFLSDRLRRRKPFLVVCIGGMVTGMALLAFASNIGTGVDGAYAVALTGSAILGFFVMSAGPIGFQYAAEITRPAPEAASQGLLLLSGQITGLLFVAGMSLRSNRYLPFFMYLFVGLAVVAFVAVFFLRESTLLRDEKT